MLWLVEQNLAPRPSRAFGPLTRTIPRRAVRIVYMVTGHFAAWEPTCLCLSTWAVVALVWILAWQPEARGRHIGLRLLVVLWGTTAFGYIHVMSEYFTMLSFSVASVDIPPGFGYVRRPRHHLRHPDRDHDPMRATERCRRWASAQPRFRVAQTRLSAVLAVGRAAESQARCTHHSAATRLGTALPRFASQGWEHSCPERQSPTPCSHSGAGLAQA